MKKNKNEQKSAMENDLHELFLDEIADLLNAETVLTKTLPKMAKAANCPDLSKGFSDHLKETENHVARLKKVFASLGEPVKSKKCKAMAGLVAEGAELMKELKKSHALDAGLIAAAQKVEHYEIASYGTVCTWAKLMGHTEALSLLKATLAEEKAADQKLTGFAETTCNLEAEE